MASVSAKSWIVAFVLPKERVWAVEQWPMGIRVSGKRREALAIGWQRRWMGRKKGREGGREGELGIGDGD
jgi:hypothetical protein